jgi:hypothetical protein
VGNDAHSHELLSVITAVHHQRVGKTLDNWALGLSETLLGIATGGMGDVDGSTDLNVIAVVTIVSPYPANVWFIALFHIARMCI